MSVFTMDQETAKCKTYIYLIVHQFEESDDNAAYILIAIGFIVFIISFLGYFGSLQENTVLLTAYGLFLIIILAIQVKCTGTT